MTRIVWGPMKRTQVERSRREVTASLVKMLLNDVCRGHEESGHRGGQYSAAIIALLKIVLFQILESVLDGD